MTAIGVFSDSGGDLGAFDAALKCLNALKAKRFLFAGGRYQDLDDWLQWKREEIRAQVDYRDQDFLEDVGRHLLGFEPVGRPPAFGTAWELGRAVEDLTRVRDHILRVPERGSLAWQDPSVPKKVMDLLGETLCCVVHDKNDLDRDDLVNAQVLVHGNELEPKVVQIGPRAFVTPGRLSGAKEPTVGLLEIVDRQVTFSAHSVDGKMVLDRQVLQIGAKTKLSVK